MPASRIRTTPTVPRSVAARVPAPRRRRRVSTPRRLEWTRHQLLGVVIGRRMTVPCRLRRQPRIPSKRLTPTPTPIPTRTMSRMQRETGLGLRISRRKGSARPCLAMPTAGLRALACRHEIRQHNGPNLTPKHEHIQDPERARPEDRPRLLDRTLLPVSTFRATSLIQRRTSSTAGASPSPKPPPRKQHSRPDRVSLLELAQASSALARGRWRPPSLSTVGARKAST